MSILYCLDINHFIWWVGESFGDLFKTKKKMKNGELEREAHGGVGWGGGGLPKSSQEIQVMSAMVPFSWCEIMCAYHILSRWGSGGKERAISFWFPFKICFPWPLDVCPIPCCVFMDVSFIHSFIHPYFFCICTTPTPVTTVLLLLFQFPTLPT